MSIFEGMKNILCLAVLSFGIFACTPASDNSSSDNSEDTEKTSHVSFVNIEDGATLQSPFYLEMGVEGMQVEPKGLRKEGFGHHHLLINDDFAPAGTIVIADDTHIHYGGGQTSDSIALDPGTYKLTLQFADGLHVSYGEEWSKSISVTVE